MQADGSHRLLFPRCGLSSRRASAPTTSITAAAAASTMNYLKSITTSVLNSTGVSFPFTVGERIPGIEAGSSIWELREGVKKVRPSLGFLLQWHWRQFLLFSVN